MISFATSISKMKTNQRKLNNPFKSKYKYSASSVTSKKKSGSEDELVYANSLQGGGDFAEVIVFDSVFHSPVDGGGAWGTSVIIKKN